MVICPDTGGGPIGSANCLRAKPCKPPRFKLGIEMGDSQESNIKECNDAAASRIADTKRCDGTRDAGVLSKALRHAEAFLGSLDDGPVAAAAGLASLRAAMEKPLQQAGMTAEQALDELVRDASPGLIRSSGGRFFGWVVGGTLPAALAADWLTGTWDQNAALHACSPAAAVAEEVAGKWLKQLLGLPGGSSFAF